MTSAVGALLRRRRTRLSWPVVAVVGLLAVTCTASSVAAAGPPTTAAPASLAVADGICSDAVLWTVSGGPNGPTGWPLGPSLTVSVGQTVALTPDPDCDRQLSAQLRTSGPLLVLQPGEALVRDGLLWAFGAVAPGVAILDVIGSMCDAIPRASRPSCHGGVVQYGRQEVRVA